MPWRREGVDVGLRFANPTYVGIHDCYLFNSCLRPFLLRCSPILIPYKSDFGHFWLFVGRVSPPGVTRRMRWRREGVDVGLRFANPTY